MCRNIKRLRNPATPVTDGEIYEAALQYVRKISGYRQPSNPNREAFEQAVHDIAENTRNLLIKLGVTVNEISGS